MANALENNQTQQKLLSGAVRKKSNVSAGVFVGNIAEKRYLWTARAFAIIVAVTLCCNILLFLTIMQVLPLYRIEPFLLTFQNKDDQVYNIVPLQSGMDTQKSITEVFVRQYILLRSSFSTDIPEMEARWMPGGPVQEMSSNAVYQEFLDKTAKRALALVKGKSLVRNVKILSINELNNGLWQVEYETRDMYPSSPKPEVNYWTASMRVAYRRKTTKNKDRLTNPIGFTVTAYSLTYNKVE